jgi:hypothetical protein
MHSFLRAIAFPMIFLLLAAFGQEPQKKPPSKNVDVSIKMVDSVWKAVLTGTTKTEVHVYPGDKVIFHAEGTDVFFQFDNDKLFGGHNKSVKNGKKLTLGVGQVAKGEYIYSAFCFGPQVFAQGDSPPKIIVD